MAHRPSTRHRVYLLTVWREECEEDSGSVGLRFSLKDPHTGERRGFASAEALTAALASTVIEQVALDLRESASRGRQVLADGQSEEA